MSRQTAKRAEPIAHCHVFIDRPLPIRRRRAFGNTGILRSPINSNCFPLSQPERNSRSGVVGEEPESSPSWSAPGLVARPPLPRDSASPLGATFDLVNLLCSAEFLDSVGRPQPVTDAWVEAFDPSTSIPFLLFSWFVRIVSPKADPTFAETGSGGLDGGGRSGFPRRPLLQLDWLPAIMT
ncbi:hypothetical protein U1Q18_039523 [Sarracenia purpurea var. burkii]